MQNHCRKIKAVLSQLLPSLQSQEERERKVAILILMEVEARLGVGGPVSLYLAKASGDLEEHWTQAPANPCASISLVLPWWVQVLAWICKTAKLRKMLCWLVAELRSLNQTGGGVGGWGRPFVW